MKIANWIAIVTIASSISACATISPSNLSKTLNKEEQNNAGVKSLVVSGQLRTLDLASIVESFVGIDQPLAGRNSNPVEDEKRLNLAIAKFYSSTLDMKPEQQAQIRGEIQGRIIAAANQRCGLWKNSISERSAKFSLFTGIFSSAVDAASLAFTEPSTTSALKALGSTSHATSLQYEKSYLFNQTVSVIFLGVDTRRKNIFDRIREKVELSYEKDHGLTSIAHYPLSSAIADALEYHSACTAASGLQKASEALSAENQEGSKKPKPSDDTKDGSPQAGVNGAAPTGEKPPVKPTENSEAGNQSDIFENRKGRTAAPL